jgi:hypothetical protein
MFRISGWPDNPAFIKDPAADRIPNLMASYQAGYFKNPDISPIFYL